MLFSEVSQRQKTVILVWTIIIRCISYFSSRYDKFAVELIPAKAAWWNKQSAICDTACDALQVQV